ncbi:hypothetical protein BV22DRAFT_300990 [Leucogyrophana mollusca]|uniref:Uncharacterized protein n=1 Tax=Leucogyrophana mollusca TaxID=85980 RepID=A0ACB8BPS0_9AGAM|nr:hypothetical protein BV22DRAFT_300990 [Leucogyrophana mollusca]
MLSIFLIMFSSHTSVRVYCLLVCGIREWSFRYHCLAMKQTVHCAPLPHPQTISLVVAITSPLSFFCRVVNFVCFGATLFFVHEISREWQLQAAFEAEAEKRELLGLEEGDGETDYGALDRCEKGQSGEL